jgi:hypothetical protein
MITRELDLELWGFKIDLKKLFVGAVAGLWFVVTCMYLSQNISLFFIGIGLVALLFICFELEDKKNLLGRVASVLTFPVFAGIMILIAYIFLVGAVAKYEITGRIFTMTVGFVALVIFYDFINNIQNEIYIQKMKAREIILDSIPSVIFFTGVCVYLFYMSTIFIAVLYSIFVLGFINYCLDPRNVKKMIRSEDGIK